MKFHARCMQHSCTLRVKSFPHGQGTGITGLHWTFHGDYYELKFSGFMCPAAAELGQDGFKVSGSGMAIPVCRISWVLEPIDDEAKPDQVLVDRKEILSIAQQLRGIANRLGALIGLKGKVVT